MSAHTPVAGLPAGRQDSLRTPADYAIEHAEYMAQASEHVITAVNALHAVYQSLADGDGLDPQDIQNAESNVTEMLVGLRGAIYEFRKRRDRAAIAKATGAAA